MNTNYAFYSGFEFLYMNIKPKIIAEKYLENFDGEIYVYKVFCFNGKAESIMFLNDRQRHLKMSFYDLNWNKLNYVCLYPLNKDIFPQKM